MRVWAALFKGCACAQVKHRYWLQWYDDPTAPFWRRHAALTWIPAGLGFTCLGLAILPFVPAPLMGILGMASCASVLFVAIGTRYAPTWLKPGWLRERDLERPPPNPEKEDDYLYWTLVSISVIGMLFFLLVAIAALEGQ